MQITLEELLKSRDERHEHQLALLKEHPGLTLVCLTVVMPGSVKRNVQSLVAGHAGLDALRERFAGEAVALEERDLDTGYEVYLLTGLPPLEAKKRACEIEEHQPYALPWFLHRRFCQVPPRRCFRQTTLPARQGPLSQ